MSNLQVFDAASSKLTATESSSTGLLIGSWASQTQCVIADVVHLPADKKIPDVAACVLPHGLSYIGAWAGSKEALKQLLPVARSLLGSKQNSTVYAYLEPKDQGSSVVYQLLPSNAVWAPQAGVVAAPEVLTERFLAWIAKDHCLVRCNVDLVLRAYIPTGGDAAAKQKAIGCAFEELSQQVADERVVFLAQSSAPGGRQALLSPSASGSLQELLPAGASPSALDAVPPLCLRPMCACSETSSTGATAPVFQYMAVAPSPGASGSGFTLETATLQLDVLCYVRRGAGASGLGQQVLRPALVAQLEAAKALLTGLGKVAQVKSYHFLPPGLSHHATLLYPDLAGGSGSSAGVGSEANEAKLAPLRRQMHGLLGLPDNRPALRFSNALDLSPQPSSSTGPGAASGGQVRLRDVHVGLGLPAIGGTVSMVDGSYDYHHYMQDRFNDNGWGCAYRSLQTICSWFRIQQYTNKPSPSHREIQETLVRLGDKPSQFVGSNNWIGAIELSYVLDDLLGVSCRIVTVNKGSDIPNHARELAAHFKNQGTPIMIGGGVLAYTLLGVQFNEQTGDCAFLILDPHYTGGEDLKKIHQGTWVGWKRPGDSAAAGGPLFVNDAFYNFLCPIRPKEV